MHRHAKARRYLWRAQTYAACALVLAAANTAALVSLSHFGQACCAAPVAGDTVRLSFPKDYIVGSLYRLQPMPAGYSAHYGKFFASARGDVTAPRDMRFNLKLSYRGGEDLSFMDKLPPGLILFLEIERLSVTDQQFKSLKCLSWLEGLTLTDVDVTDRGFMELQKAQHLRYLVLKATLMTGKGLAAIRDLKTLEHLDTEQNLFDDAAIANLSNLKKLRLLRLKNARITDVGLKHIANLPALNDLSLAINQVTDRGVATLVGLKNLRKLNLTDTKITVKCIDSLQKMPNLEKLSISFCDFTPPQLAQFKQKLHCQLIDGRESGADMKLFSPLH